MSKHKVMPIITAHSIGIDYSPGDMWISADVTGATNEDILAEFTDEEITQEYLRRCSPLGKALE